MELVVEGRPQRPTVRLRGEVDVSNAPQLLCGLIAVARRASHGIVVDLAETTFLDCRGVAVLLITRQVQRSQSRSFELRGARGCVRKVIGWAGLAGAHCDDARTRPRPGTPQELDYTPPAHESKMVASSLGVHWPDPAPDGDALRRAADVLNAGSKVAIPAPGDNRILRVTLS
jgi:anti-anti-sigma factor